MECRKKLPSKPNESARPLEYLCRGCGIVECRECSISEHTERNCSLVSLSALGRKDIDQWCVQLKENVNRSISIGTKLEERQKSAAIEQRNIANRTKEICQSIEQQFALVYDRVKQAHDSLIVEAKEVESAALLKLNPSAPSTNVESVRAARNISQQLFDLVQNTTDVTKEILVEFLQKKTQVDQLLKATLCPAVKNEFNQVGNSLDQFHQRANDRVNQLISTISRFDESGETKETVRPGTAAFSVERRTSTSVQSVGGDSNRSSVVQLNEDPTEPVVQHHFNANVKLEVSPIKFTDIVAPTIVQLPTNNGACGNDADKLPQTNNRMARNSIGGDASNLHFGTFGGVKAAQRRIIRPMARKSTGGAADHYSSGTESDEPVVKKAKRGRPPGSSKSAASATAAAKSTTNGFQLGNKLKLEPNGDWWPDRAMCAVCRKQNRKEDGIYCDGCDFVFHPSCHLPPLDPKNIPQGDWFCGKCVPIRKEDLSKAEYDRKMCERILLRQFSFSKTPWQIVKGDERSQSVLTDLFRIRQHLLNSHFVRPEYLAVDMKRMYEWQAKTFKLDYMIPKQPGKTFGQKILDYHRHFKLCFDQYFPGLWSEEFDLETPIGASLISASASLEY